MTRDDVVLVGVDGSAASLHALDWAAAQARAHGWGVRLVCSYSLPSFTAASLDGGYAALDDTAIQEGAKAVLAEATERVASMGVPVTAKVLTGDAAGVLVEHVARRCGSPSSARAAAAGSRTGCSAPSRRPCPRTRTARPSSSRCGRTARRCPTMRRSPRPGP